MQLGCVGKELDMVGWYKIYVILLNMENGVEAYSILLGRPWLKQAKTYHNWGDSTLTIISKEIIGIVSTIKKLPSRPLERLKCVDVGYD